MFHVYVHTLPVLLVGSFVLDAILPTEGSIQRGLALGNGDVFSVRQ